MEWGDDSLLDLAKTKLRIDLDDARDDAQLLRSIGDGQAALRELLGVPDGADAGFSDPGDERSLLMSYVFYDFNDALDDFEANYAAKIARCRNKWMVRQHAESEAQPADV